MESKFIYNETAARAVREPEELIFAWGGVAGVRCTGRVKGMVQCMSWKIQRFDVF